MNEITRIHIAKTAYDVETTAKKELQQYIGALDQYANDPSILEDIEIRITELLAERGVERDCVITASDVAAVRQQLGEPQDFAEDGELTALPVPGEVKPRRRLYRDYDKAVFGGVLAGIATYLGVNPLWTRLAFIVLLIGSFGTMAIIYLVLWIALPPARTAAEKLELEGKLVSLAAIKDRSEDMLGAVATRQTAETVQRVMLFCLGLVFVVIATGSLIATAAVGSGLVFGLDVSHSSLLADNIFGPSWQYTLAFVLLILSGLLFAALNAILAVATFSRKWTKRIGVSVVVIIVSGIVAFSGGVGTVFYGDWAARESIQRSMVTDKHTLAADFSDTRAMTIDMRQASSAGMPTIIYTVSDKTPHYELSYPAKNEPKVVVTQQGDKATLSVELPQDMSWYPSSEPVMRIYGPALEGLSVQGGTLTYLTEQRQKTMTLTTKDMATVMVEGVFESVKAQTEASTFIDLEDASVRTLQTVTNGGSIEAGVVRELTVSQPDVCPATTDGSENTIEVEGVSGGEMQYNGATQSVVGSHKIKTSCGVVVVGDDENSGEYEQ